MLLVFLKYFLHLFLLIPDLKFWQFWVGKGKAWNHNTPLTVGLWRLAANK